MTELRIAYRQNGQVQSDICFCEVPFWWTKQQEADAREFANSILCKNGCGTVTVYVSQHGVNTTLYSATYAKGIWLPDWEAIHAKHQHRLDSATPPSTTDGR